MVNVPTYEPPAIPSRTPLHMRDSHFARQDS